MKNSGNKNATNISRNVYPEKNLELKLKNKINSKDLNIFSEKYGLIILPILQLQNGSIHSKIMRDVKSFLSYGYSDQASIKMALKRNRFLLEDEWNEKETDSEEENTDPDEEDSQESDDEKTS